MAFLNTHVCARLDHAAAEHLRAIASILRDEKITSLKGLECHDAFGFAVQSLVNAVVALEGSSDTAAIQMTNVLAYTLGSRLSVLPRHRWSEALDGLRDIIRTYAEAAAADTGGPAIGQTRQ